MSTRNYKTQKAENQGESSHSVGDSPFFVIQELRDRFGVRFVLCNPDKSPVGVWRHRRPTAEAVERHLREGGLVGVVPASARLIGYDFDGVDCEALLLQHPPRLAIASRQADRLHVYYDLRGWQNENGHITFPDFPGLWAERRSGAGYLCMHGGLEALASLRAALNQREKTGEACPPPKFEKAPKAEQMNLPINAGSNTALFDAVRTWAGGQVLGDCPEAWTARVIERARLVNLEFLPSDRKPESKVKSTARSVARYFWDGGRGPSTFRERQAWKAHRRAARQREKNWLRDRAIIAMSEAGASQRAIAAEFNVSRGTVQNVLRTGKGA